jgi:tRNA1(Val) A37 N6-methylase TrmN6
VATFETTDDAVLGGKLKLLQPVKGHRAGHDAILLAAAAPACKHAADLGAGVGTAGLALLARGVAERVTLIEIDADLAALAKRNAEQNGFAARCEIIAGDVLKLGRKDGIPSPAADLALMNPPFNDPARKNVSPDSSRRRAHSAGNAEIDLWITAAERALAPNGTLVLIHRPEAIETILASLNRRFGAAELIPIFPRPGVPAIRLIVRAIKGRRTPPSMLPGLCLNDANNQPSDAAEKILRDMGPLGNASAL